MFTSRAFLFGFVGFCFYLIAFVNSLPTFYYALTWLTAGVLASCLGTAILSLFGLHCMWSVEGAVVSEAPERAARRAVSFFVDEDDDEGWEEQVVEWDSSGQAGLQISIANRGTFNKTDITLEAQLYEITRDEWLVRTFLVEALPSGAQLVATLPLHDLKRGRYRVVSVLLRGSDVLGLFRFRKKLAPRAPENLPQPSEIPSPARFWRKTSRETRAAQELASATENKFTSAQIVVGPVMQSLEAFAGRGLSGRAAGVWGGRRLPGRGEEFSGTRPYVVGDDLRLVHWKSTARRGEFVVREWERTSQEQTLVIWDGAAPTARERAHQRFAKRLLSLEKGSGKQPSQQAESSANSRLPALRSPIAFFSAAKKEASEATPRHATVSRDVDEWALHLTASLFRVLNESARVCGLLRLDAQPYLLPPAQRMAPALLLARAQEILADAHPTRTSSLVAALAAAPSALNVGNIYLVTASTDPDVLDAVRLLKRETATTVVCLVDGAAFDGSKGARASRRAKRDAADPYVEQEERLRGAGVSVIRVPSRPVATIPLLTFRTENDDAPDSAMQMQMLRESLLEILQFQSSPTALVNTAAALSAAALAASQRANVANHAPDGSHKIVA